MPGVVMGHNERVAWSMTAFAADTQDIFVERVNPERPRQVLENGEWVETTLEFESVAVKGRTAPYEYERQYTRRGIVIGRDSERHLAYTLRWSGAAPGGAAELAALALNRAASAAEFRTALARWTMPAAEFVFADADGTIGMAVAAAVPQRSSRDGLLPSAAWNVRGTSGGTPGRAPDAALLDPLDGFVVSANEDLARTARLRAALGGSRALDAASVTSLQRDVYAVYADWLVPLLERVRAERADVEAARAQLLSWDRRVAAGSAPSALYVAWEEALARRLAERRIPPHLRAAFLSRVPGLAASAFSRPTSVWFDAPLAADRDRQLIAALGDAVDAMRGGASAGALAPVIFWHPLGVTERARARFNVGPIAAHGYASTVQSIARLGPERTVGPAFRAVFDLADWDRSVAISAPGQSSLPASPHYRDQARLWAAGEYVPLAFSDAAVAASAAETLILTPVQ
jgi:penicillin amidase